MIENEVLDAGTHLLQKGYITPKKNQKWHRSRERRSNSYSPFCAYMMNKKWWLEEEFTNHILRFQQVNMEGFLFKCQGGSEFSILYNYVKCYK